MLPICQKTKTKQNFTLGHTAVVRLDTGRSRSRRDRWRRTGHPVVGRFALRQLVAAEQQLEPLLHALDGDLPIE